MSDLDLTTLVDAAARQQWTRMTRSTVSFDDLHPTDQHAIRSLVLPTVALVAPMAELQTRQAVAFDLEAAGHTDAARVVRLPTFRTPEVDP